MTAASPISSERTIEPELFITEGAVVLEITPVTVAGRITSGLIDHAVYALGAGPSVAVVMMLATSTGSELQENLALIRVMLSPVLLTWMVIIPLFAELLSEGRSLGRMATGTRMVRDDDGTVKLHHCLIHTLLAVVEIWGTWAVPAPCASIVSERRKRFGDVLADAYVVREHHRSHMASPLLMPLELAQWTADTDLRALLGNLSLTACTFLQRASFLVPSSRHQLELELASQVREYVSPPSSAGAHPEWFLATVLIKCHNRELVLESRDRRLKEDVLWGMARPLYRVGGETRRR